MSNFDVSWQEDGSATVLARLTGRSGSGSATGIAGEGNWLQQADVSTITCKVFDLNSETPTTAIVEPSVTVSTDVLDTPVTSTTIWTRDTTGYNFLHDLSATAFPTGGHDYRVEYKATLANGTVFHWSFEGEAASVSGS
jgi:hypothetical protein